MRRTRASSGLQSRSSLRVTFHCCGSRSTRQIGRGQASVGLILIAAALPGGTPRKARQVPGTAGADRAHVARKHVATVIDGGRAGAVAMGSEEARTVRRAESLLARTR